MKAIDPKPVLSWTSGQPTTSGPSINPPWEWGSVTLGSTGPRDFGGPSEVATLRPTDHRAAGLPASEEARNHTLQADPGVRAGVIFPVLLDTLPRGPRRP